MPSAASSSSGDWDLVIRGGTLADGTGGTLRSADIAIRDGKIAAVGTIREAGKEEIDATGLLVTPGFVDIHTHYDGQATWDERLTPSSWHGVTTVVAGNCGVGFAPCRPEDHETLIKLMEGVEDIPGVVLTEGLSWDWESFPEFLDAIEARPHDIDIATQLPHGALRVYVMGQRGADLEPATEADIRAMAQIAREAIEAGALGFSTSRTLNHRTSEGKPTPSLRASAEELQGIANALGEAGTGVLQFVSDFKDSRTEMEMLEQLCRDSGRPLSVSIVQTDSSPDHWRELLKWIGSAREAGLPILGQVAGRPVGLMLGLDATLNPFVGCAAYREIADLPFPERVAEFRRPERRKAILDETAAGEVAGPIRALMQFDKIFQLGDPPDYEQAADQSLASRAARAQTSPAEYTYDRMLEDEGRALLYLPFLNYANGSLEPSFEMMQDPGTVLGLGDGGAHLGTICDASFSTHMLTHWTRDRSRGAKLPIETVVKWHTHDTANAVGLQDRGVIAPGYKADLNLIDYAALRLQSPETARDLPAAGRRLLQRADGYRATIVSGEVTYRDGQPTGRLPGRLIRGEQPKPSRSTDAPAGSRAEPADPTPVAPRLLEPQCEWTADDVADESTWTEVFTPDELEELDAALRHAISVSSDVLEIERKDFPLPRLAARLERIENELINGRGFVRLRGIDRSRYDQDEMEMLYWGIGMHLGTAWPQNKHGHLLGDVTDQGKSLDDPTVRGNEIGGAALPFHCDGSDLVGLMCLKNGLAGGLSKVACSVRIHNQLVREAPELAAALYAPLPVDYRGEERPGGKGWYWMPAFSALDERLFVHCVPPFILASQRHADAPRLTPAAKAALERLIELANDPQNHVAMELRPGDMQFINNYHVMHGRSAYEDDRGAGRIRHLKRLWLATRQLERRPEHLSQPDMNHWGKRRTASRMKVG